MTKPPINKVHERLNQIRRWLKSNPHYFRPTHLVLLRSVIEDVATPGHVETLQCYLKEWKLPDAEAEAQKTGTAERIRQAEEARAEWLTAKEEAERQGVSDPPYPTHITPGQTRIPSTQPTVALP